MLLRSLGKAMYHNKNGRVVSELLETSQKRLATIDEDDIHSGYIYVVRSLSHNPQIQSIENLYKIGFSTTPVTERVKNALKEPTYLMAPVHVIFSLECYNMNTQKFEQAIHTLLGKYCVNLDIFDEKNKRHSPREWFSVDFTTIEKVIDMIVGE
jgi:hypothetical protein